jgi:hypothetical protein
MSCSTNPICGQEGCFEGCAYLEDCLTLLSWQQAYDNYGPDEVEF